MRRVVVTGMGIVSSIGNNTQEVLSRPARGEVRHLVAPKSTPSSVSARRCTARRQLESRAEMIDRRAMRFLGDGAALESHRHGAGDPGFRPRAGGRLQRAHRHHHGLGRALDPAPSSRPPTSPASKGPKRVGPFAVPKAMSSTASATLATWFKIKGVNYSISSACATSNHCIGNAYETIQMRQAGRDVRRRLRGARLDAVGAVRRDGRDVVELQRHARRPPRRAYDINRDGFVIAGGAGVVVLEELEHAKARGAQDLRRDRRLRRDVRRLRHGRAVGRGRRALHAHGDGDRATPRSTTSTRTPPRRRSAIRRRSRRSARCSAPATNARRSRRPSR